MNDIRRTLVLIVALPLSVALFVGCDESMGGDSGADSATRDSGRRDSSRTDTDPPGDSAVDTGSPDTSVADTSTSCGSLSLPAIEGTSIGPTFSSPMFVTYAPGDPGAIYIVEQRGTIQRFDGTNVTEFIDITSLVGAGGERGLLGLAFHPDYDANGRYFLYYTPPNPDPAVDRRNRVAEFSGSGGTEAEVVRLIDERDPEGNHNGGMIAFGPDGFLYVGMGDGGGGGDDHGPIGNGLNTDTYFGKIHRLDVDNAAGSYAAAGNPFEAGGGLPQIWAYGLRNPWRFSFDRNTGDLWIGDVGQNTWEEIDYQPASSTGGENYGWRAYEGLEVFRSGNLDEVSVHAEPIHVYEHVDGACSVTGGYVYRGDAIPALRGWYVFADLCNQRVQAFRRCEGAAMGLQNLFTFDHRVFSFGEDEDGELYVMGASGSVMRLGLE